MELPASPPKLSRFHAMWKTYVTPFLRAALRCPRPRSLERRILPIENRRITGSPLAGGSRSIRNTRPGCSTTLSMPCERTALREDAAPQATRAQEPRVVSRTLVPSPLARREHRLDRDEE